MSSGESGTEVSADAIASLRGARVVLLCFTQEPCSPGNASRRLLDEVSGSFGGRVAVSCVSPENSTDWAREFFVAGTITLALFVDGEEKARSVGEGGEAMMRTMIERYAGAR